MSKVNGQCSVIRIVFPGLRNAGLKLFPLLAYTN